MSGVHWKVKEQEHERAKKLFPELFNLEPSNEIPGFCNVDTEPKETKESEGA